MSNPTRQQIIDKAIADKTFRAKLLSNPKQTIEEEIGENFRPSVKVTIVQEDADNIYYVLPVSKGTMQAMPDSWFIDDHPGTEP